MTSVVSIEVDGLGTIPAQAEVTSQEVLNAYAVALAPIINVFNDAGGDPVQQYVDIGIAVSQLLNLADQGIFNAETNRQEFVTVTMARQINLILRSLTSVGYDPNGTPNTTTIPQWRDLADVGLREILQGASNAIRFNRSLQAIIELEYVRTGNEQIFNNLSSLQENLQLTQDSLTILERAQSLKNSISPPDADPSTPNSLETLSPTGQALADAWDQGNLDALNPALAGLDVIVTNIVSGPNVTVLVTMQLQGPFCTVETFAEAYSQTLDALFGEPLLPVVDGDVVAPGVQPLSPSQIDEFIDIREDIQRIIEELDIINGTAPGDPGREGTLAGRLEIVLQDMSTVGVPGDALTAWILDAYAEPNNPNSGNFQRNLTEAITTGQSINDQQRQELRRQLFVFEEFYRSASAILIAINQIINRMASNISR